MYARYWKATFLGKAAVPATENPPSAAVAAAGGLARSSLHPSYSVGGADAAIESQRAAAAADAAAAAVAAAGLVRSSLRPSYAVAPLASIIKGSNTVVIEVWQSTSLPKGRIWSAPPGASAWYAVLISLPQSGPDEVTCGMGFGSHARVCDSLRELGLPVLDANIALKDQTLSIEVPSFVGAEAMSFTEELIHITGVDFADMHGPVHRRARPEIARFVQRLVTPQALHPAEEISTRPFTWDAMRKNIQTLAADAEVSATFNVARFPDLQPLKGKLESHDASRGDLVLSVQDPPLSPVRTQRREDAFVPACFRFDNVEVLGFRIDLDEVAQGDGNLLNDLVGPLNFHLLNRRYALPDFRYRPATHTISIELLRYGKMALDTDSGQLTPHDYQSQHELVIRLLVGRVDDDTAQARDPAVFVPAIFVDNPWSKVLGREGQGFDKRLAVFRSSRRGALRADGFPLDPEVGKRRVSVMDIDDICLAGTVGKDSKASLLKLEIDSPNARNPNTLDEVDLDLALGDSRLVGAAWRQHDFNHAEFRRSFAGSVMTEKTLGFRSVQISPLSNKFGFPSSWLIGRFDVERVMVGYPAGIASLIFNTDDEAPRPWTRLWKALGGSKDKDNKNIEARIDLPTGDWYRLNMKMRLTMEDGMH